MQIDILRPQKDEKTYILATWTRGYISRHESLKKISQEAGAKAYARIVQALYERGNALCAKGASGVVLGFIVYHGPYLHYMYVRSELRRKGIGRALLAAAGLAGGSIGTHWIQQSSRALGALHVRRCEIMACAALMEDNV